MARIVLFGGSFNPIHFGHLRLAVEALEQFQFEKVWLLPAGNPPHRPAYPQSPQQRLHMLHLACATHPQLEVCDYELQAQQDIHYTVETLSELGRRWPQHQFSFLTGMDALVQSPWRQLDQILAQVELFLLASRPGFAFAQVLQQLAGTPHLERVRELEVPVHGISSSLLRQRLLAGRSLHFWLPEPVRVYLEEQGIYTPGV